MLAAFTTSTSDMRVLDVAHANFVPEPRLPQCHYVLGVPLDCDELQIAAR